MKVNQHNNSTTIYLEQIQNHISLGKGYDTIRKHLFRELYRLDGENIASDDKLPQSIVSHLTAALDSAYNFHRSQQIFRIIQIIEDFLTYASEIMNPAMHNESFLSTLINTAKPKIISFNSDLNLKCSNHVYAIFIYWNNQYSKEEDCPYPLFIAGYERMREFKYEYNQQLLVKTNPYFKNEYENQKKQKNGLNLKQQETKSPNRIILDQIQEFTLKSEELSKTSIKNVATTQYVRLIKHKSKVLYEFTSKPGDFNQTQKTKIKDFYKRLRVILKQIQKYNENAVQIKKHKISQKQYVQQKLTPKKGSQQNIDQNNLGSAEKKGNTGLAENTTQILVNKSSDKSIKIISPQKTLKNKTTKVETFDLLSFEEGPAKKELVVEPEKVNSPIKVPPPSYKPLFQTFDLLGDIPQSQLPKQKQEEEQFVDGILIDMNPATLSPKEQQKELQKIFSTPKKQAQNQQAIFLAKESSGKSEHSFQNEKNAKNPYSFIPNNIDLTPTSSNEDQQERITQQKSGFNFFGLLQNQPVKDKYIYDYQKKPYDDYSYRKNKQYLKKTPQKQTTGQIQIVFCQSILNEYKEEQQKKYIEPIDYSKYDMFTKSPTSEHNAEDQQQKLKVQKEVQEYKDLNDVGLHFKNSGEKIKVPDQ